MGTETGIGADFTGSNAGYTTPRGDETRRGILSLAVEIASEEGLQGLTIGRLASDVGMSKSGLFAHFGSKEGLQLATVAFAGEIFGEKVLEPVRDAAPGLARLFLMMRLYIAYVEDCTFRGGCFFAAASAEMDGRPGAVCDAVAKVARGWRESLVREAGRAIELGHLESSTEPNQLAFELHAYVQEANWAAQLLSDQEAYRQARVAVEDKLRSCATPAGIRETKVRKVVKADAGTAPMGDSQRKGA